MNHDEWYAIVARYTDAMKRRMQLQDPALITIRDHAVADALQAVLDADRKMHKKLRLRG